MFATNDEKIENQSNRHFASIVYNQCFKSQDTKWKYNKFYRNCKFHIA